MPIRISRGDGFLEVTLKGLNGPAFGDALAKVKTIPGRRYNMDEKRWELPDEPNTLMHAVEVMQPELSADLRRDVQAAQGAVADDLVTRAGEDADLLVPWGSELWAFQRAGVDFMVKHPRVINADDMGLGKTLQSITAVEEYYLREHIRREQVARGREVPADKEGPTVAELNANGGTYRDGPVLVICPNSTREAPWKQEIENGPNPEYFDTDLWPAGLKATIVDAKKPKERWPQVQAAVADNQYVVINWEKLKLIPEMAKVKWAAVIADEAHRAKNKDSKQSKALRKLKAPLKIAATGTPIMNSPDELWPLLNWMDKTLYSSYWRFFNQYVEFYEGYKGSKVITGVRNPDALRFELRDKLIRRTKLQVLDDFPEKLPEEIIEVEMLPAQKRAYSAAQNDFLLDVQGAMREAEPEKKETILQALRAGDLGRIGREVDNAAARISFMRQIATSPVVMDRDAPDKSSKLDAVQEKINDHKGKQFVVACWHKASAEALAARLRRQKPPINVEVLHGDIPAEPRAEGELGERAQRVQDFQEGKIQVLISTIAVGGVGITLTAADTILFIEEDWVPANNRQMEDRLWRIGQKNDVTVIKYRSKDTVDTNDIAPANELKKLIEAAVLGED